MADNLIDTAIEGFRGSGEEAALLLRDGGRITGKVADFDGYIVVMSGTPDYLVYRHSILKLVPAGAVRQVRAERPDAQKRGPARESRPKAQKPRRGTPRRETPSAPVSASPEPGFSNPMAEAMQKWLKSQKGGV